MAASIRRLGSGNQDSAFSSCDFLPASIRPGASTSNVHPAQERNRTGSSSSRKKESGTASRMAHGPRASTGFYPEASLPELPPAPRRLCTDGRHDAGRRRSLTTTASRRSRRGRTRSQWGLRAVSTLDGTMNPDFDTQVEVDPAVVNLRHSETFFGVRSARSSPRRLAALFHQLRTGRLQQLLLGFDTSEYPSILLLAPGRPRAADRCRRRLHRRARRHHDPGRGEARRARRAPVGASACSSFVTSRQPESARLRGAGERPALAVEPLSNYLRDAIEARSGDGRGIGLIATNVSRRLGFADVSD